MWCEWREEYSPESEMGVQNPEQCRPEVSSLIHPEPDPSANSGAAASPVDEGGKSIVIVQTCSSPLAAQCLEFESETGVSASGASFSDYDLLYESLQRLDCDKLKRRGSKNKRKPCGSCNRKCCGKYRCDASVGRQGCFYAASFAADCVAICCCPCAIVHIFVLAFVKVPCVYARKAFSYAKRKARSIHRKKDHSKNNNEEEEEEDENGRSSWYYTPPWSCRESPQRGGLPLDGSRSFKVDTEKLWSELYAAGHMGFGGLPFERN